MKQKLWLLLGCFVAFYYLLHIAYDLPYLVNGRPGFVWVPTNMSELMERLVAIMLGSLFALGPYLILYNLYPRYRLLCALLIVVSLPAIFLLGYWVYGNMYAGQPRLRTYFRDTVFYSILYTVFGLIFYFIRYTLYKEVQQKELLLQQRQSELSFLRSQVNPHFLFNSLNNIYSLVYQGSSQSLAAIAGLSDLLRYMLYDATEKVPLEKEIDYIRKYIELQKLRFEGPVNVSMQVTGATTGTLIPPLLLVPFVENAFKHGDFAGQEGLALTVHCTRQKTWFYCHNKKGNQQKDASGGIGLDNVKRRLALLYPGRHHITVDNTPDHFTVNLELLHE